MTPPLWLDAVSKKQLSPLALSYLLNYLTCISAYPQTHAVSSAVLPSILLRYSSDELCNFGHRVYEDRDFPYDISAVHEFTSRLYKREFSGEFELANPLSPPSRSACRGIIQQGFLLATRGLVTVVQSAELPSLPIDFSSFVDVVQTPSEALNVLGAIGELAEEDLNQVKRVCNELRQAILSDKVLQEGKVELKRQLVNCPPEDWRNKVLGPYGDKSGKIVNAHLWRISAEVLVQVG